MKTPEKRGATRGLTKAFVVTNASRLALAGDPHRRRVTFQNNNATGGSNIFLCKEANAPATTASGFPLVPGQGYTSEYLGNWYAITDGANADLRYDTEED